MQTKIIAHRGASYQAPENTLAAVNLAWQLGSDGVEVDVRLTGDNQIIVYHDKNTRRYQGDSRPVEKRSYSDLLSLDVGRFKGEIFRGERIPLLSQVLDTVPENGILVIDIKSGPEILAPMRTIVDESRVKSSQIIFISFRRDTILSIKKHWPEFTALGLYELRQIPLINFVFPSLIRIQNQVIKGNLDGMDINLIPAISRSFIKNVKDQGLLLYFWTINDPVKARFLYNANVDGITTDRPNWLKNQIINFK